jgi:hypothetical protein
MGTFAKIATVFCFRLQQTSGKICRFRFPFSANKRKSPFSSSSVFCLQKWPPKGTETLLLENFCKAPTILDQSRQYFEKIIFFRKSTGNGKTEAKAIFLPATAGNPGHITEKKTH